ncbi:MAG: hypothetical protein M1820_004267 [Bogoriella megaspora]|nr:MAG: hypothetical protein M1820_004267 [Bogoriella megaspora]
MKFSSILTLASLALTSVEATPLAPSNVKQLEKRSQRDKKNYEVATHFHLPADAKAGELHAFTMTAKPKDFLPLEHSEELNQITTDKEGSHTRIAIGYVKEVEGEGKNFAAHFFDLLWSEGSKISDKHPNGDGLPVEANQGIVAWTSTTPRQTIKYVGKVTKEPFSDTKTSPAERVEHIFLKAEALAKHWGPKKDGKYDHASANCFNFVKELWAEMGTATISFP